jgi:hypothetical protein
MSRLTGTDALGLFEAYQTIYSPQELTEEQVWEEVENWVNSLLEEGYDLSDYTWEEMYEAYLSEMGQTRTTGQMTAPKAAPRPTSRPQVAGGGMGGMRGSGRDRNAYQTSSSPGALRVPAPAATAPTKPAATAPTKTTAAPAKPAATAPARPAAPAKPAAAAPTTPKPTPAPTPRVKDTSITDMIGRSQVRQGAPINTGNASSDARAIAGRASVGAGPTSSAPKPAAPVNKAMGSRKPGSIVSSFDLFDVIKGHLLDEGYADTEESALAIMANMSEEWRESIVEESMPPRRSKEERSKRAKELGDRQTIRNVVGKYNKEKPSSKQENPDKYYSNN